MSGWNSRSGFFELTATKARWFLRRGDVVGSIEQLLTAHGIKTVVACNSFWKVKATAAQIWAALSGTDSRDTPYDHQGRDELISDGTYSSEEYAFLCKARPLDVECHHRSGFYSVRSKDEPYKVDFQCEFCDWSTTLISPFPFGDVSW